MQINIKTNPNKELVDKIRKKLEESGGYCPCRLQKTEDTKCICKEFRDMIESGIEGQCHCGLYILKKGD